MLYSTFAPTDQNQQQNDGQQTQQYPTTLLLLTFTIISTLLYNLKLLLTTPLLLVLSPYIYHLYKRMAKSSTNNTTTNNTNKPQQQPKQHTYTFSTFLKIILSIQVLPALIITPIIKMILPLSLYIFKSIYSIFNGNEQGRRGEVKIDIEMQLLASFCLVMLTPILIGIWMPLVVVLVVTLPFLISLR